LNRTLVIGDIHGGMRALEQILVRANVTLNDHLIFLGDYVDGWSQSPEVIDTLIHLGKSQNVPLLEVITISFFSIGCQINIKISIKKYGSNMEEKQLY